MKKRIQRKNILVIVSTPYTFFLYLVSVYMSQCVKFSNVREFIQCLSDSLDDLNDILEGRSPTR
jgi:hypothetical protein